MTRFFQVLSKLRPLLTGKIAGRVASTAAVAGVVGLGYTAKARHDRFIEKIAPQYIPSISPTLADATLYEFVTSKSPGLDTELRGAPRMYYQDGTYTELNSFSTETWRDFLSGCPDDANVTVTLVDRRAFSDTPSTRMMHSLIGSDGMRHPLVYVQTDKGEHALFGYLQPDPKKGRPQFFINDVVNMDTVSHSYTVHDDRRIILNKEDALKLFEAMETSAAGNSYTGWSFNCGTPLADALLSESKAEENPEEAKEIMRAVMPLFKLNYGLGTLFSNDVWTKLNTVHEQLSKSSPSM